MKKLLKSRIWLVVIGIALGLLARATLGGPENEDQLPRTFQQPLDNPSGNTGEMPIKESGSELGLVPPIRVPEFEANSGTLDQQNLIGDIENTFDVFTHGDNAEFHAHGEEVCASGCAASRHPTEELSAEYFDDLMVRYAGEPISEDSPALEELLYYGPQSKKLIEEKGFSPLGTERASFLWDELKRTHAKIAIRVIDEEGEIRTWLEPTLVPFDRRHVFRMETSDLQPLVTSGTLKRVGLDHMWVRL